MDINEILGGVRCACGRYHECDIEAVYVERGAIARLRDLCAPYEKILLVADENTYAAAGEAVENALADKDTELVLFPTKILVPDEAAVERVEASLDRHELLLAIGSGVIQDLCKYVSHFNSVPYMDVATAPSMDGYASDGAAMILKGMKETVPATLPRAIVADTQVLANAPMDMIRAGYGDIIGKYSALNDWRLSHLINGEYFCQYIYDSVFSMVREVESVAKGIAERDEKSIQRLTEALIYVGIMMKFAGSSRPASGSEHHLSHFFEITGIVKNEPYLVHGIDVAYSTVITAEIRERITGLASPKSTFREERGAWEKNLRRHYGEKVGNGCIALQDAAGIYADDRTRIYAEKWGEICKILSDMPSAEKICDTLSAVGLDIQEFYKTYGMDKIRAAITYAKDLKNRYTVLWLNCELTGDSPVGTEEL